VMSTIHVLQQDRNNVILLIESFDFVDHFI